MTMCMTTEAAVFRIGEKVPRDTPLRAPSAVAVSLLHALPHRQVFLLCHVVVFFSFAFCSTSTVDAQFNHYSPPVSLLSASLLFLLVCIFPLRVLSTPTGIPHNLYLVSAMMISSLTQIAKPLHNRRIPVTVTPHCHSHKTFSSAPHNLNRLLFLLFV